MKHFHTIIVTFFCSLIFTSNCFSQHASFQRLGDLPGGDFSSQASGVSDDGLVVVGSGTTASGTQAFRWTPSTGIVSLGNLPNGSFQMSSAGGISGDGTTIVGYGNPTGTSYSLTANRGFRWTQAAGMVDFSSLVGTTIQDIGISGDGSVMFGRSDYQAFRWTQSGGLVVGLGTLPGRPYSLAIGVSADGSIVVGSCFANTNFSNERTFRWTKADSLQSIGTLSGYDVEDFPNAISPDGSVIVGTSYNSNNSSIIYRWTQSSGMVAIGNVPGRSTSHPGAVSTNGTVIVGSAYTTGTDFIAFIWDEAHGIRILKDVLQADYGLNLTGWTLSQATAITPNGNIIVGMGINSSGQQEAFRVVLDTLLTDVHQEKSTGAIKDFRLYQNYPNPFNPTTVIGYQLSVACNVKLAIYNLLGQKIKTLLNSFQSAGEHSLIWDAMDEKNNQVSSGIYFYRIETDKMTIQKKMVLVR